MLLFPEEQLKQSATQILMFIPNLLKLVYRLAQDEAVGRGDRALLLATIAYVLSPWDFLPDMVPFLGQVDDLLLLALVIKRLMDSVSYERLLEYWDGNDNLLLLLDRILEMTVSLLPPPVYRRVMKKAYS